MSKKSSNSSPSWKGFLIAAAANQEVLTVGGATEEESVALADAQMAVVSAMGKQEIRYPSPGPWRTKTQKVKLF